MPEIRVVEAKQGDRIAFPLLIDSYVYPEPPPVMRTVQAIAQHADEVTVTFDDGHTQVYKINQHVWVERADPAP